jgi:ribosomal protein S2
MASQAANTLRNPVHSGTNMLVVARSKVKAGDDIKARATDVAQIRVRARGLNGALTTASHREVSEAVRRRRAVSRRVDGPLVRPVARTRPGLDRAWP